MTPFQAFKIETLSAQKTILLWVSDYLDFLFTEKKVLRGSFRFNSKTTNLSASIKENAVCVEVGEKSIFIKKNPWAEAFRKIAVRMGKAFDYISLDEKSAVHHVAEIRKSFRSQLSLKTPETPCRFLLRIDDYPAYTAPTEKFLQVHNIFLQSRIPYLLGVTPFIKRDAHDGFLTEREIAILQKIQKEGADLALHGFTHEKRLPSVASELEAMPHEELNAWIEKAKGFLAAQGMTPFAFIAPFNAYVKDLLPYISRQFSILCGGPESVHSLGYRIGPSFLADSVYLPSYRGAYDVTEKNFSDLMALEKMGAGQVIPITIHWTNGLKDDFKTFCRLAAFLEGKTLCWKDYLALIKKRQAFLTSAFFTQEDYQ